MVSVSVGLFYLIASILFILALRDLSHPTTAKRGNLLGMIGMVLAIIVTISLPQLESYLNIILAILLGGAVGILIAQLIKMTALPQLVAIFHSLVGLAAVCVATATLIDPTAFEITDAAGNLAGLTLIEMAIGTTIGAITFSGSVIAFAKLQGILSGAPLIFLQQHKLNLVLAATIFAGIVLFYFTESLTVFVIISLLAMLLGVLLIMPIGGADMPVVVSMLNSYSGWTACGIGFTLGNIILIITGALVGSSGAILSYIMCKGMNRSIFNVILGGFGGEQQTTANSTSASTVKTGSAVDAAFIMSNASSIIIVPGYGLAVAQAQFALHEMITILQQQGVKVSIAIHPVAGRMPGHMNVLLAEAGVDYEDVFELDAINRDFATADVAFVIGANDITNPAARSDKSSPIYGMPVFDVEKAKTTLFVKRSLAPGYAGIDNSLFYSDKTYMLFGDAKELCDAIIKSLE